MSTSTRTFVCIDELVLMLLEHLGDSPETILSLSKVDRRFYSLFRVPHLLHHLGFDPNRHDLAVDPSYTAAALGPGVDDVSSGFGGRQAQLPQDHHLELARAAEARAASSSPHRAASAFNRLVFVAPRLQELSLQACFCTKPQLVSLSLLFPTLRSLRVAGLNHANMTSHCNSLISALAHFPRLTSLSVLAKDTGPWQGFLYRFAHPITRAVRITRSAARHGGEVMPSLSVSMCSRPVRRHPIPSKSAICPCVLCCEEGQYTSPGVGRCRGCDGCDQVYANNPVRDRLRTPLAYLPKEVRNYLDGDGSCHWTWVVDAPEE